MCGIFGAVGYEITPSALERVLRMLQHRGPDGQGLFKDERAGVTLAHTRLSVIDLLTGSQPLSDENGDHILVCNGEIYDFERIRSELEAKGHQFRTRSDSEVIIHLYKEHGLSLFAHLRGEFAFLLYDRIKQLLIAGRDRFGIKPLYMSRGPQGFVFASEMKAIFASGLIVPKLNIAALDPLAEEGQGARFPFENIEHVPPASYIMVDLATLESQSICYWQSHIPDEMAEPNREPLDEAAAVAARNVTHELEEAVRLRLRADVPVGLYLSGGLDSAFVGALMKRNLRSPLHSFSISFAESEGNEQAFARRMADLLRTQHHDLEVGREALWDHLEDALWFSELPFVSLAPVGKFLLSREARKFVTVVLTGEGADEVFLGYRGFFERAIEETRAANRSARTTSARLRRLGIPPFFAGAIRQLSLLLFEQRHRQCIAGTRSEPLPTPSRPVINAVQEARLAQMPFDILCFLGDREEMAHSLEARLPFLDHRLFDVARRIPVDLKFRRGTEKAVLRDAAKGLLPEDIRLRRKSGFMMTSDAVDFGRLDRCQWVKLHRYLSPQKFRNVQIFSYRSFRTLRLLTRLPRWSRTSRRIREAANKIIMYMVEVHMLHDMFIERPRWNEVSQSSTMTSPRAYQPVC